MDFKFPPKILSYFILSCFIFGWGIFCGILTSKNFPFLKKPFLFFLKNYFEGFEKKSKASQVFYIFFHNAVCLFFLIFLGWFFLIPTFFGVYTNGFILGFLFLISFEGGVLGKFLKGILPHGIIEIPVILIGGALGIYFWKNLFTKKIKETFLKITKIYLFFLLPLLFISALIEVLITPLFLL